MQSYALVLDCAATLPHPRPMLARLPVPPVVWRAVTVAREAMKQEERDAGRSMPQRKPKRQAAAMKCLRSYLYPEFFEELLARRLRRWGEDVPPAVLRERWHDLRAVLTTLRPTWLWSWTRTATNPWTTSGRMHVIAPRTCLC